MTLCIAAACREGKEPRLVLCSDHKIGSFAAQAEIGFKFSWVTPNWPALIAGDLARTEELVATFKAYLDTQELHTQNVFDCMKAAGNRFREKLADELVRKKLSVSYEYLRQNRAKFPSATVYETYTEIGQIDSEAELICGGFLKERVYMFVVARDCTVSFREHFAAIGTGAYIAEPALFQREQHRMNDLPDTLYRVYEAKKLGEIADAVGEKTSIVIVSPASKSGEPVGSRWVSAAGFKYLHDSYVEFGLKEISMPKFQSDFLEET